MFPISYAKMRLARIDYKCNYLCVVAALIITTFCASYLAEMFWLWQFYISKSVAAVGFEPTPPKRLVPKTSALDRSATLPVHWGWSINWYNLTHIQTTEIYCIQGLHHVSVWMVRVTVDGDVTKVISLALIDNKEDQICISCASHVVKICQCIWPDFSELGM